MGTKDTFGNYTFTMYKTEYRINALQWRDKRSLRGKMAKVMGADGELDPFSDGFYDLQDWVLTKVAYVSGEAMVYLKDPMAVEQHFVGISVDVLEGVDSLFNEAISVLAENFISPAAELSDPVNSTADAGDSSNSQSTQNQLSAMLKE